MTCWEVCCGKTFFVWVSVSQDCVCFFFPPVVKNGLDSLVDLFTRQSLKLPASKSVFAKWGIAPQFVLEKKAHRMGLPSTPQDSSGLTECLSERAEITTVFGLNKVAPVPEFITVPLVSRLQRAELQLLTAKDDFHLDSLSADLDQRRVNVTKSGLVFSSGTTNLKRADQSSGFSAAHFFLFYGVWVNSYQIVHKLHSHHTSLPGKAEQVSPLLSTAAEAPAQSQFKPDADSRGSSIGKTLYANSKKTLTGIHCRTCLSQNLGPKHAVVYELPMIS